MAQDVHSSLTHLVALALKFEEVANKEPSLFAAATVEQMEGFANVQDSFFNAMQDIIANIPDDDEIMSDYFQMACNGGHEDFAHAQLEAADLMADIYVGALGEKEVRAMLREAGFSKENAEPLKAMGLYQLGTCCPK